MLEIRLFAYDPQGGKNGMGSFGAVLIGSYTNATPIALKGERCFDGDKTPQEFWEIIDSPGHMQNHYFLASAGHIFDLAIPYGKEPQVLLRFGQVGMIKLGAVEESTHHKNQMGQLTGKFFLSDTKIVYPFTWDERNGLLLHSKPFSLILHPSDFGRAFEYEQEHLANFSAIPSDFLRYTLPIMPKLE